MKRHRKYFKTATLTIVALTIGIICITSMISKGSMVSARAEILTNSQEGIYISQIDGWTSGNRHSGINFTLDAGSKVTPNANTAIVIDYENLATTDTYVSFYLNGMAVANRINSTTQDPKGKLYLFNDTSHVKTYEVSTGSADINVKHTEIGKYDKMVIKISDFNNLYTPGIELDLSTLFFGTRLNLAANDRTKSDINGFVKGMHIAEYNGGATLELSSSTKIYTPQADNFVLRSGVDDATARYLALNGMHAVPTIYELSDDGNGHLSLEGKVFIGGTATLTITPKNNTFVLDTLTINGVNVTSEVVDNKYTISGIPAIGIAGHVTFKVATPLSTTLTSDGNGLLSVSKEVVYEGDSVDITVEPNRYYELEVLTVNGSDVSSQVIDGKYNTGPISDPFLTAHATFRQVINFTGLHGRVDYVDFTNGEDTLLSFVPDAGYEIQEIRVSGVTVVLNKYNQYRIIGAVKPLNVSATFAKATTFHMDEGSLFSINNNKLGNTYALWDSVNVKTAVTLENSSNQYVGITLNNLDTNVSGNENLVIQLQNTDSNTRSFYIEINETTADSVDYYLIDRLGNFITKSGIGASVGTYARFENATFNSQYDKESFAGAIVLPLSRYGLLDKINTISIRTAVTDVSRARFNVGSIYLDNSLDTKIGWMNEPSASNLVWKPTATNWSTYETPAASEEGGPINYTELYTRTSFIEAGTMVYGLKDEVTPASPNYDTYHGTFPQNAIGEDGYVDLKGLGIKGMIFDVENHNVEQVQFAIRIAGAENSNLTDTSKPLWQTSTSTNGRFAQFIYDNGVVQNRGSKYLPVGATGYFKGSMYIPLSEEAFTKLSNDSGSFPGKIQPVFRILFADPKDYWVDYDVKITNFRFVTDDTPYQTNTVTLIGPDATINAKVGDMTVQNDANNHLLDGTELVFDIEPNVGYHVDVVSVARNGVETILMPNENGQYSIIVDEDVVISATCSPNIYSINYNLDGGTNSEHNLTTYEYGGLPFDLENPTKEGHTFLGWINEDGEEVTEIDTFAAEDYNLTAKWKKDGGDLAENTIWIIAGSSATVLAAGAATTAVVVIKKKKVK